MRRCRRGFSRHFGPIIHVYALLSVGLWSFCLSSAHSSAIVQGEQFQNKELKPLEVRLVKPPEWVRGCLSVDLERTNLSPHPLFIPDMGLYISTSVTEEDNVPSIKDREGWINVFGASDLWSWEAEPLAPGATIHDEPCLYTEVAIVSLKRQTRRKIPLRGRLRIDAFYFLTRGDWQQNKAYHEALLRTPPEQRNKLNRRDPQVVTIFGAIPCHEAGCGGACGVPPLILHGENRVVPDVFYLQPDWEARGKRVADELAHKSPACPEPSPESH